MKKPFYILFFFFLAVAVRILFWLWSVSGFYFYPYSEVGLTLTEGKFLNGYGMAAGYGYQEYFDESESFMVDLMEQINQGQLDRLTPEVALPLPENRHYSNFRHPPGTSLLVYFFHRTFGGPADKYVLALSIFLDSLAAVLLMQVVGKLLGQKMALITGLLYIFCLPVLFHTAYAKSSIGMMMFFMVAIVAVVIKAVQSRGAFSIWGFVIGGLLLGICSYFRSDYIVLPFFILPGIILSGKKWSFAFGRVAIMILMVLVVLSPWAYRNYQCSQRLIFTSAIGPAAFYAGLGTSQNPWGLTTSDDELHKEAQANGHTHAWSLSANDYFLERYKACVRQHPLGWLKVILHKLPFAVATPYYWGFNWPDRKQTFMHFAEDNKSRFQVLCENPIGIFAKFWDRVFSAVFVFLCLVGVVWMLIKQRGQLGLLVIFIAPHFCAITVHILTHWESRYTTPSLFCWVMGFAYLVYYVRFRQPIVGH